MSSVSTTNISGTDPGTDHDFGRPSGTGVFLYRYPGTSYLATITLSLRDKIHSSAEALLKLTLMDALPRDPAWHVQKGKIKKACSRAAPDARERIYQRPAPCWGLNGNKEVTGVFFAYVRSWTQLHRRR